VTGRPLAVVAETRGGGAFLLNAGLRAKSRDHDVAFGYVYDPSRGIGHLAPLLSHVAMLNGVEAFSGGTEARATIQRQAERLLDPDVTARRLSVLSERWGGIEQSGDDR
jgi:hypothetical protein